MANSNNNDKSSYLIQWRTSVWVSMREKEANCWKFIAVYVPAVLAMLGVGSQYFPPLVLVLACLAVTAWGILTIIDANYWFSRNLRIVSNVERYIAPYVYEQRLIPAKYAEPRFTYLMSYRTMMRLFTVVFLGVLLWSAYTDKSKGEYQTWALVYLGTCAICLWVLLEDNRRRKEYAFFSSAATGSSEVPESPERLDQAMKAIRKFDTRGPIIHFVTASLQMVSLLLLFEFYCPAAKGSIWHTISLIWPFATLFLYPLTGVTPRFKRKKMRAFVAKLLFLLRLIFVISLTIIITSVGSSVLILQACAD